MNTTFIELAVDGDIVDLNRIPLPADTPIIDERFNEGDKKDVGIRPPAQGGGQGGNEPASAPPASEKKP